MKDNYKKNKIFLYNNTIMSRTSPSATPLWPFIYGLGIVAFIYFLTVRAGIAIFLIFMIVGVTMIMFWVYYNARTKQNSDIKFIAKPVHLQSRKSKSLTRTEMRLLYSRYRRNHQKFIS
jgi:hypothetical protein